MAPQRCLTVCGGVLSQLALRWRGVLRPLAARLIRHARAGVAPAVFSRLTESMPAMETTVLIADDHPLFREALRLVVAEALGADAQTIECASLDEAREQVAHSPNIDLALMDLNMPGMDGLAGLASLRARMPTLPIIVVSADERHATVDAALRAGVSGFIPKSFSRADMAAAVNAVLDGDIFFPATSDRNTGAPPAYDPGMTDMAARIATLTKQERCILEYLIRGKSNKFVAIELDIAESTVKAHVSSILRKLKVHSRTLAVIKAGPLLQLN